jgi:hypothetical protein
MSYEADTAGRYRKRAAKLRAIAEADAERATIGTLMDVARDYELMATLFDGIDHENIVALRAKNSN